MKFVLTTLCQHGRCSLLPVNYILTCQLKKEYHHMKLIIQFCGMKDQQEYFFLLIHLTGPYDVMVINNIV